MKESILVVDDDAEIVGAIAIALEREGYQVRRAYDGLQALDACLDPAVKLIIIDVMMPNLDGLSALLRIRERRNLPVIVLSAKSEDTDKILGLSMGADDYVTKPYNPQELVARVRSQLRRYRSLGGEDDERRRGVLVNGRLAYDTNSRTLKADGEPVRLTPTETKIFDLLIRHPGQVFPAEEIYRRVWNEEAFSCENTVMVHIRRIREKIELNPKEPDYVKVVWGIGYKWNSTDKPSVIESVPLKEGKPKRKWAKAIAGFLSFVLGVSLTIGGVGSIASRLAWERDLEPRFGSDWQDTDNFRAEVASTLRDFLTIGAGGKLDFYNYSYWEDYGSGETEHLIEEAIATSGGWWGRGWPITEVVEVDWGRADSVEPSEPEEPKEPEEREPDANFKNDKNVLYRIECADGKVYRNTEQTVFLKKQAIDGYNFYLQFADGKTRIFKDGQELDVYGSGVYDRDSQWFVPGYDNFPATDQLDGVAVYMAVRETPARYYNVDYKTGSSYNNSSMYYLAQRVEESQQFYRTQAIVCGLGILWLIAWFSLRRATEPVNRKIASWTVHVWTELRFLAVLGCVLLAFLPGFINLDSVYDLFYNYYWDGGGTSWLDWLTAFARFALTNAPALAALFWVAWLIHNDHRYNPKEARRSLLRPFRKALQARDLKRPVEKRISRSAVLLSLAILVLGVEVIFFLILLTDTYMLPIWALWTLFLFPVLLAGLTASALTTRQYHLAKDIAALANQVEAVRAGDLSKPLVLPEDADLRKTAESLNDIQAGMKAALEEQTRSERMKVELVSNVSHDLKTPLTSILSYAELLRQEDLPPAAADYAKIIDEKAQRLKSMVEDVFEVSKAAADQLPVKLEKLDLAKLIRQTLADMDGAIQNSALTFKIDLPEEAVMISADGKRLYRVFQNLIDNALRYALEGSRVYLSLKTVEGTAEARVRNTSRNELPEGVDFTARFVRGDASRTDGGSGLGLSIASSFVEACGGAFRVETVADLFTAIVTFPTL